MTGMTDRQREILFVLKEAGEPLTPAQVYWRANGRWPSSEMQEQSMRSYLNRMVKRGYARAIGQQRDRRFSIKGEEDERPNV